MRFSRGSPRKFLILAVALDCTRIGLQDLDIAV